MFNKMKNFLNRKIFAEQNYTSASETFITKNKDK